MRRSLAALSLTISFLAVAPCAHAVFPNAIPLQSVVGDSKFIFTVKVTKVDVSDPEKPSMTLALDEELKDKAPVKEMRVSLIGDDEAKKLKHRDVLLKRVAKDVPILLFVAKNNDTYIAFAFTNGTWFQMYGEKDEDRVHWRFNHCEPALRGTYKGTTEELKIVITDVLAGKKAPAHNPKEPPGFGPELKQEDKPKEKSGS
jgi:hypothetical protein